MTTNEPTKPEHNRPQQNEEWKKDVQPQICGAIIHVGFEGATTCGEPKNACIAQNAEARAKFLGGAGCNACHKPIAECNCKRSQSLQSNVPNCCDKCKIYQGQVPICANAACSCHIMLAGNSNPFALGSTISGQSLNNRDAPIEPSVDKILCCFCGGKLNWEEDGFWFCKHCEKYIDPTFLSNKKHAHPKGKQCCDECCTNHFLMDPIEPSKEKVKSDAMCKCDHGLTWHIHKDIPESNCLNIDDPSCECLSFQKVESEWIGERGFTCHNENCKGRNSYFYGYEKMRDCPWCGGKDVTWRPVEVHPEPPCFSPLYSPKEKVSEAKYYKCKNTFHLTIPCKDCELIKEKVGETRKLCKNPKCGRPIKGTDLIEYCANSHCEFVSVNEAGDGWEERFDKKFLDMFENRRGVMPLAMAPVIKKFIVAEIAVARAENRPCEHMTAKEARATAIDECIAMVKRDFDETINEDWKSWEVSSRVSLLGEGLTNRPPEPTQEK